MSAHHPVPAEALDDRLGYFGTAGSGKTYNAGSGVERLLHAKKRVVIPDPLGVWWGLRLNADGKSKGFDVAIFGGPHGDLPLTEHAGALVGETVAGMKESCILDLSELGTKAAERRFMLAFLTALYKHASGEPVHVVFDEADMWAPQQLRDKEGEAAKLLGMMETLVRRGRVKGFIPWLISQRPAVLNKDVMSQVDGLVAFKLTSVQDRDAIGDWVQGQADVGQWKEIWKTLPTMERGQGVVWLPSRGTLKTASFPQKATFDSSRTPKRGEKIGGRTLKPLNLDTLRERLAIVEAETKANDPKALKAELAKLKAEIAAAEKTKPSPIDPAAIAAAEERGFERGKKELAAAADRRIREARIEMLGALGDRVGPLMQYLGDELKAVKADKAKIAAAVNFTPSRVTTQSGSPSGNGSAPSPARAPARQAPARTPSPAASGDGSLKKAERLILTALAQYPDGRTKNQVAILTGYAVNGGGFNNALSALRSADRMQGSGDWLQITELGLVDLGSYDPLPHGAALLDHWMRQLGKAERAALSAIANAYPEALTKEDVAQMAGYAPDGGGFNNALSRLRTFDLIEGKSELRASEALFG